jgi:2-polyprenyl-6-methoxyphenol hydroxylase-like FAD-dependent oxidoreductase
MMTPVSRVLIAGGGPAGLTAATALRRSGIETTIVESNHGLQPLGSGLTMMGPTLRALAEVDVRALERCIDEGAGHPAIVFGNAHGEILQRVQLPTAAGSNFPGGFGITRPVFWGILAEMAQEAGAQIRLATTITSVLQREKAVVVGLSDGTSSEYDLLIGADGLHSMVRELIFPDAPRPVFNGQTVWRAMVPRAPGLSDEMGMYYGPHNKAGCNPVSDTEAYVFLVENADRRARPPREQWPQLMRDQLRDYEGVIGWARERMTDPDLVDCRPLQVLLLPSPWYRGRTVLIGDAAHATTPHLAMGAGIAIEDGIVLAQELATHDTVDDALEAFMKRRYERCRIVVENSAQLGAWEQDPEVPTSEHARLSDESWAALAAPI